MLRHVFLCHGHAGRWTGKGDGAAFGADPGATDGVIREVDLSWAYIGHTRAALQAQGVGCTVLSYGQYSQRHAYACAQAERLEGRVAYLACHVNAADPPGSYGAYFYDSRSRLGRGLAESLTKALGSPLGMTCKPIPAVQGDWTANALSTISGVYQGPSNIAGICLEPFFINQPSHDLYRQDFGLRLLGRSLADALVSWGSADD